MAEQHGSFFVCLASMKWSQTNTKPSYRPRKLIGGLTQQSAQPDPQNSAGTWHGEVNWGTEKPWMARSYFCVRRVVTATGTELKREKGERRGFKFIKTL